MKEYFIINENKKSGPFNLNKIKQEYLFNDTLVWHEGLDNWVLASEIKELKNLINDKSIKDYKKFKSYPDYNFKSYLISKKF